MNRALLIALIVAAVLALAAAVFFISQPTAPGPSGTATSTPGGPTDTTYVPYPSVQGGSQAALTASEAAAQSAFVATLASDNPDNIKPKHVVVVGDYALQSWVGDITGGEALLKYANGTWTVVELGGGAWTVQSLVNLEGVPADVAASLVAGISQQ